MYAAGRQAFSRHRTVMGTGSTLSLTPCTLKGEEGSTSCAEEVLACESVESRLPTRLSPNSAQIIKKAESPRIFTDKYARAMGMDLHARNHARVRIYARMPNCTMRRLLRNTRHPWDGSKQARYGVPCIGACARDHCQDPRGVNLARS